MDDDAQTSPRPGSPTEPETIVLPLHTEVLQIDRRRIETGRVRVQTRTLERPATVDETLTHERVEVARVAIGRQIEAIPPVREENGVTIIPVVEEMLVIERRLVLKEEVHLRRVRRTEQHRETVMLRNQEAVITRDGRIEERPSEGGVAPASAHQE